MAKYYSVNDYEITQTGVKFECSDKSIKQVFDSCEALCKENTKQFGDRKVLQEGAKYNGVWLETQPMGGEMYAMRDMEVALNNQLIFMQNQRIDGRIPGMITYSLPYEGLSLHMDWMQGDFFTVAAMRMYYLIKKDKNYLEKLYETLSRFDDYLWEYRDSDGDGCLESWCTWDTGNDNNTSFFARGVHAEKHGSHCGETAPTDKGGLPFESAEYMAYSYSHCVTLAEISKILGNGEESIWFEKAEKVRKKANEYLWDNEKKAYYDRDRNNEMMYTLTLENMKCLYHGLFTQEMADEFIKTHLMNKDEFLTPLPLPHIAANDPLFYVNESLHNLAPEIKDEILSYANNDIADNSWSGPVHGLNIQRSIDGLLRYGHHAESTIIGKRWISNLAKHNRFVQQYNPMTGEPAPGDNGFGPTVLSALEYIAYLYGVDYVCDELIWSSCDTDVTTEYTQHLFDCDYKIKRENGVTTAYKNGNEIFKISSGLRVVTDLDGNIKRICGMEDHEIDAKLEFGGKSVEMKFVPNQKTIFKNGEPSETVYIAYN